MPVQPFIGQIMPIGFGFPPEGWALCNGQLLPIVQYTALFSLLGANYGGNGQTTFALPDLRSRVPIGAGQGPGLSDYGIGDILGDETIPLGIPELPAHGHTANAFGRGGESTSPAGNHWASGGAVNDNWYDPVGDITMSDSSTTKVGGNVPHSNIQPYLVINFAIALKGTFPQRPS
jgi:microcystin-dependent protein